MTWVAPALYPNPSLATSICEGEAGYLGDVVAGKRREEGVEMALGDLPAARLLSHVKVEPELMGGVLVRMPDEVGAGRIMLSSAGIVVLVSLVFLALGVSPGWYLPVFPSFFLVGFLFAGFRTWRLGPGTATVEYGWRLLVKLGFKQVFVGVTSVRYELEAWDNADGAWHNVKLVSSGRKPQLVVSRTSHGPLRNQLPISSSASLDLIHEVVAIAQLFAKAVGVPGRVVIYVVPAPDPWWIGD